LIFSFSNIFCIDLGAMGKQFQGGCVPPGDGVNDTPFQALPTSGCPVNQDTCPAAPGLDPVHNYMDYSDDPCLFEFTMGQRDRARAMWDMYRRTSSSKSVFCFSGYNSIFVVGKGFVSMEELQVGDFVMTSNDGYKVSRVLSFLHKDPEKEVEYLQIYTTNPLSVAPLEVTQDHYVFKGQHDIVEAQNIKVGDILGTMEDVTVTEIRTIKRRGLYAPLTESGDIWVSGVRASSYVAVTDRMSSKIQALVWHSVLAPIRLGCTSDFSLCKNSTNDVKDGFSSIILGLSQVGLVFICLGTYMQLLVLVSSLPFLLSLSVLELIFTCSPWYSMIIAFIIIGHMALSKKNGIAKVI
jgi:hypothetical protein